MKTIQEQNESRRKKIVAELLAKPHAPDSYAAQRIEALGETPDYTPADEGEAPEGAHWK